MFSVGQTVYQRNGKHSGKVLECDGRTVYLMQENGVEIEFRDDELTAVPLRLGMLSKNERGYALAEGRLGRPAKRQWMPIDIIFGARAPSA